jgi:hypothetical protein
MATQQGTMKKRSANGTKGGRPKRATKPQAPSAKTAVAKRTSRRRPAAAAQSVAEQKPRPATPTIQVTIIKPTQGQKITLPFTATGTTTCSGGATVQSMQYQIDEIRPHSTNPPKKSISSPYDNWSFSITSSDCTESGSYQLTVFASDGTTTFHSQTVDFTV